MKTKKICKQRKQEREFEIANYDLKSEFEEIATDDVIDEMAYVECLMEEDD